MGSFASFCPDNYWFIWAASKLNSSQGLIQTFCLSSLGSAATVSRYPPWDVNISVSVGLIILLDGVDEGMGMSKINF